MSDIREWLEELSLGQYADVFEANDITLDLARDLTDADLRDLDVSSMGHRKALLRAIEALSTPPAPPSESLSYALIQARQYGMSAEKSDLACFQDGRAPGPEFYLPEQPGPLLFRRRPLIETAGEAMQRRQDLLAVLRRDIFDDMHVKAEIFQHGAGLFHADQVRLETLE